MIAANKDIVTTNILATEKVDSSTIIPLPFSDFVVSKNKDGTPLSRYDDDYWDRTPYDVDGERSIFSFRFWKDGETTGSRRGLMNEMRWILYLLIFQKPGNTLGNGSIRNYLKPLNAMARFCDERKLHIRNVLGSPELLMEYLSDQDQMTRLVAALLNFLKSLGPELVGYDVADKNLISVLRRRAAKWADQSKQHPPIPTRIYSKVLSLLSNEIYEFEQVADQLLQLLENCLKNPLAGRAPSNQWKKRCKNNEPRIQVFPIFSALIEQHGLAQFWKKRSYSADIRGLSVSVLEISIASSLQIQAFTGMRLNEVETLPFDCLEETIRPQDGTVHYVISGRVRKLKGGKKKAARWVTSESGRDAVRLAQRISRVIFDATKLDPTEADSGESPTYLFSSAGLFRDERSGLPADLKTYRHKSLLEKLPFIEEADLVELEQVDPHRAWRLEPKFTIGERWPLTSHQLRRSLALYAQRSGLVSLPTLKRQLQHITSEMSSYYGRGSAFAAQFIVNGDREKHFGQEWQEAQPVSQFLSYAIHVLFSDETELFGVHPHWVKHRLKNENGVILLDRTATLKRFQKGELAYRETLLGGCVKVGECDQNPLDLLHVECITTHCKNMVGYKQKLQRVINAQQHLVDKLAAQSQASAEYRHEQANLSVLHATLSGLNV